MDTASLSTRPLKPCAHFPAGEHFLRTPVKKYHPYTVVHVHYSLGDYDKQVKETMTILGDSTGPALLMGDLNLVDPEDGLAPIRTEFIDTCEAVDTRGSRETKQRGTFRFRSKRIDYIFVDPDYFTVLDVGLTPEEHREPSDHLAYFACVTVKNRTK
ncbi:MAG: endonuclease/exonuclease/phosphatase family protein [Syntrophobacteria bacterium]|jgi:endonuclease/exonuclease/phosphatase family metal-dependent hydrolase